MQVCPHPLEAGVNEKERIFLGATPRFETHVREKMKKECPFILLKKAIKFEKEIEKFLVVKALENFMVADRRGLGTSLLLARRMEMAGEENGGK
jgi:hypothetical protein